MASLAQYIVSFLAKTCKFPTRSCLKDPNRHLHLHLSAIKDSTEMYKIELTSGIDGHIEYRPGIEIELDLNGLLILVLHLRLCEWF